MKKIAIISIILITFSCSTKTPIEIARFNIEEAIVKKVENPESYKFVEMEKFDTINAKEKYKESIDSYTRLKEIVSPNGMDTARTNEINKYIAEAEKRYKKAKEDEIELNTLFKCKIKDNKGTENITTFDVILNDSLQIIKLEKLEFLTDTLNLENSK